MAGSPLERVAKFPSIATDMIERSRSKWLEARLRGSQREGGNHQLHPFCQVEMAGSPLERVAKDHICPKCARRRATSKWLEARLRGSQPASGLRVTRFFCFVEM